MKEQNREIQREELRALLESWRAGTLDEREVHAHAETLLETAGEIPQYPDSDRRSIAAEVLLQLDILNHQLITTEDIPAIEAFLKTPPGQELRGWAEWRSYWKQLDLESRRQKLVSNPYYCT